MDTLLRSFRYILSPFIGTMEFEEQQNHDQEQNCQPNHRDELNLSLVRRNLFADLSYQSGIPSPISTDLNQSRMINIQTEFTNTSYAFSNNKKSYQQIMDDNINNNNNNLIDQPMEDVDEHHDISFTSIQTNFSSSTLDHSKTEDLGVSPDVSTLNFNHNETITEPFQFIFCFILKSSNNNQFNFMVLIDHLTHYTWCFQIDESNSIMNMIGNFANFVQSQTNYCIRHVRFEPKLQHQSMNLVLRMGLFNIRCDFKSTKNLPLSIKQILSSLNHRLTNNEIDSKYILDSITNLTFIFNRSPQPTIFQAPFYRLMRYVVKIDIFMYGLQTSVTKLFTYSDEQLIELFQIEIARNHSTSLLDGYSNQSIDDNQSNYKDALSATPDNNDDESSQMDISVDNDGGDDDKTIDFLKRMVQSHTAINDNMQKMIDMLDSVLANMKDL